MHIKYSLLVLTLVGSTHLFSSDSKTKPQSTATTSAPTPSSSATTVTKPTHEVLHVEHSWNGGPFDTFGTTEMHPANIRQLAPPPPPEVVGQAYTFVTQHKALMDLVRTREVPGPVCKDLMTRISQYEHKHQFPNLSKTNFVYKLPDASDTDASHVVIFPGHVNINRLHNQYLQQEYPKQNRRYDTPLTADDYKMIPAHKRVTLQGPSRIAGYLRAQEALAKYKADHVLYFPETYLAPFPNEEKASKADDENSFVIQKFVPNLRPIKREDLGLRAIQQLINVSTYVPFWELNSDNLHVAKDDPNERIVYTDFEKPNTQLELVPTTARGRHNAMYGLGGDDGNGGLNRTLRKFGFELPESVFAHAKAIRAEAYEAEAAKAKTALATATATPKKS